MQAMMASADNAAELRPVKTEHKAIRTDTSAEKSDSAAAVKDGSSFLSIIHEMLAGAMDGTADVGGTRPGTEESAAEMNLKTMRQHRKKTVLPEKSPAAGTVMPDTGRVSSGENQVQMSESAAEYAVKKTKMPLETTKEAAAAVFRRDNAALERDGTVPDLRADNGAVQASLAVPDVAADSGADSGSSVKKHGGKRSGGVPLAEADSAAANTAATGSKNAYAEQQMAEMLNPAKKTAGRRDLSENRIAVEDRRTVTDSSAVSPGGRVSADMQTVDMALYLPSEKTTADSTLSAAQKSGGKNFSQLLSQSVNAAVPDIVQNGLIVLNNNNQGTIRLTLHPETLGNVKINLKISENQVTGQITVASEEAFDAFKDNIKMLESSFAENGFETAGFNLGYSGQGGRHDSPSAQTGIIFGDSGVSALSGRPFSDTDAAAAYNGAGSSMVNIVA